MFSEGRLTCLGGEGRREGKREGMGVWEWHNEDSKVRVGGSDGEMRGKGLYYVWLDDECCVKWVLFHYPLHFVFHKQFLLSRTSSPSSFWPLPSSHCFCFFHFFFCQVSLFLLLFVPITVFYIIPCLSFISFLPFHFLLFFVYFLSVISYFRLLFVFIVAFSIKPFFLAFLWHSWPFILVFVAVPILSPFILILSLCYHSIIPTFQNSPSLPSFFLLVSSHFSFPCFFFLLFAWHSHPFLAPLPYNTCLIRLPTCLGTLSVAPLIVRISVTPRRLWASRCSSAARPSPL